MKLSEDCVLKGGRERDTEIYTLASSSWLHAAIYSDSKKCEV